MPKKTKTQKQQEWYDKLNAAMDTASTAAGSNNARVGSTTPENAKFVMLLVEDFFTHLPPAKRFGAFGALNEILCYINAANTRIHAPKPEQTPGAPMSHT